MNPLLQINWQQVFFQVDWQEVFYPYFYFELGLRGSLVYFAIVAILRFYAQSAESVELPIYFVVVLVASAHSRCDGNRRFINYRWPVL